MKARIVNEGSGAERDLVVVYFLASPNDAAIVAAAPGAIVVNDTRVLTEQYAIEGGVGITPLADLVTELQRKLGCSVRSITLCGWSVGCKAVRTQLLKTDGQGIDAVVAIDGVTGSYPIPTASQAWPWVTLASKAKEGKSVFIASHTMLTYTEKLAQPFMSTWRMLQRVTGFALAKQGPDDEPVLTQEGNCLVWSYAASSAAGHTFQGQHVLPRCLAQALSFVRGKLGTTQSDHAAEGVVAWQDARKTWGERAVAWARAQEGAGRAEEPLGSNAGPFVAACLKPCQRGGKALGLASGNWCAAFACAAEAAAKLPGDPPPVHEYRASGFELEADAEASGAWVSKEEWLAGKRIQEGDIVIFDHGTPAEPWRRHVVRFVCWLDSVKMTFQTIGGNEDNRVKETEHQMGEKEILGFVSMPAGQGHVGSSPVDPAHFEAALLERWHRLTSLSDSVMRGGGEDIQAILEKLDPGHDGQPGD